MKSRTANKQCANRRQELVAALAQADSFGARQEIAMAYGDETGGDRWQSQHASPLYDAAGIKRRLRQLRRLQNKGNEHGLLFALSEGIHGDMAGMGSRLTCRGYAGGKKVRV